MPVSAFDLFKVGIGPSSSHTVGPMRAACTFAGGLDADGLLTRTASVHVELFGSLGATGHGHGTVKAVVAGLAGEMPDTVDPRHAEHLLSACREAGRLMLAGAHPISFDPGDDVVLHRHKRLEYHSNAMTFTAAAEDGTELASRTDPLDPLDWVTAYALAVNEENAAGGRVVTAPTNGAAGIIPAVLHYYWNFLPEPDEDGVVRFLLVAAGIGSLFKENASISGAEVGCQGEVGSACSMAAGGLAEILGGSPRRVENAAEIGIEHNLGLTCDPVDELVQIPCIERNAVASIKAITAARLAVRGDGEHHVSLDKAIKTMRETGADMKDKYKETARGGLALNVVEC